MLKHTQGRVVVEVDLEQKNNHTFQDGTTIRLERQYNNLNRRETEQVSGIVVSGNGIPEGATVLFHHNALHETNKITGHQLSGEQIFNNIEYYSIPENMCFLWKNDSGWLPMPGYETALRVFKPYSGILCDIEPELLKDTLFVTSGRLAGRVVKTPKACDYEIIFRNEKGVEDRMIRFRPDGSPDGDREPEAICLLNKETDSVASGELWVGLSVADAKKFES